MALPAAVLVFAPTMTGEALTLYTSIAASGGAADVVLVSSKLV